MPIKRSITRSITKTITRPITGRVTTDPDFLAYRTLASSLVSEPFDLTATNPAFTTAVVEDIQNARFVGYKGTVPSRWSNAAVYGTAPTPVDVWNNNLTEVYGLSMVKFAGTLAKLKVASGGTSTLTNNNFVAGDYDPLSGLTGNGTSKYLDTSVAGSSLSRTDSSMSAYASAAPTVGISSQGIMGARSGAVLIELFGRILGSDKFATHHYSTTRLDESSGTGTGFVVSSGRVDAVELYSNGTSVGTSAAPDTNGTSTTFKLLQHGGNAEYYGGTLASAHIGTGMSDAAAEWLTWVESCVAVDGGYNTFDPTVRWP